VAANSGLRRHDPLERAVSTMLLVSWRIMVWVPTPRHPPMMSTDPRSSTNLLSAGDRRLVTTGTDEVMRMSFAGHVTGSARAVQSMMEQAVAMSVEAPRDMKRGTKAEIARYIEVHPIQ
jgi:hypothetical protein